MWRIIASCYWQFQATRIWKAFFAFALQFNALRRAGICRPAGKEPAPDSPAIVRGFPKNQRSKTPAESMPVNSQFHRQPPDCFPVSSNTRFRPGQNLCWETDAAKQVGKTRVGRQAAIPRGISFERNHASRALSVGLLELQSSVLLSKSDVNGCNLIRAKVSSLGCPLVRCWDRCLSLFAGFGWRGNAGTMTLALRNAPFSPGRVCCG